MSTYEKLESGHARFHFQKRIEYGHDKPDEIDEVSWIVFDRKHKSAAHFHGRFVDMTQPHSAFMEPKRLHSGPHKGMHFVPYGIELHMPTGREGQEPIQNCGILGGPCYADGTSLGASRFAEYWSGDDAHAFAEVKAWLTRHEPEPVEDSSHA